MKAKNLVILAAGLALVMGGTAFAQNDKTTDRNYNTHGTMMGTNGGHNAMGGMQGGFGGGHMQAGAMTASMGAQQEICASNAGNMMNAPDKPSTGKSKR